MQTAKLFPNGQSQAVRLPKEYRFEGDRVYIQRVGEAVVLLPYHRAWQVLFDSLRQFSADFAVETDPVSGPVSGTEARQRAA
jgi:antitoxin VapB